MAVPVPWPTIRNHTIREFVCIQVAQRLPLRVSRYAHRSKHGAQCTLVIFSLGSIVTTRAPSVVPHTSQALMLGCHSAFGFEY
jgi:hypothetical protein